MTTPQLAAEFIISEVSDLRPEIGIILGSGLGAVASNLSNRNVISYSKIPGFPKNNVLGHNGRLSCGYLSKTPVVCLEGRVHYYEGDHSHTIKQYIRTLKELGCKVLLITNAAGSLRSEVGPGSLVMITDHINLQNINPLAGPNNEYYGSRFFPIDKAYDLDLQKQLQQSAQKLAITLHEGIYLAVMGPNYETVAEISAYKILGAHLVGMSTVPEVLVACHCGLKVAAISSVTNFATGIATTSHSHENVVKVAKQASYNLIKVINNWIKLRESL